ncbi:MAG: hypothetical protein IKT40_10740 [Bacilli bacterium]|nr:hypothetical protein [Bacilli bacterium]
MNKKIVIALSLILVALIAASSVVTYAWLTSTGSSDSIKYKVGEINYTITGPQVAADTFVVPGDKIASNFDITNGSNIDTNLRVKFTVTIDVTNAKNTAASTNWTIGSDKTTNQLILSVNSKWVLDTDGFLYYGGKDVDADDVIAASANPVSPIEGLQLNGDLIGNDYSGAVITVQATFYAKQDAYIKWSEMGSINWTTGI